MIRLGRLSRRVLSLFVDDGLLALMLLAWIAIAVAGRGLAAPEFRGPIFALGILAALALSVLRSAGRANRDR